MIRWNDIILISNKSYRVVQMFGSLALLIDMNGKSIDLIDADANELNKLLSNGEALLQNDPWVDLPYRKVSEASMKSARNRYELIDSIVSSPMLYLGGGRAKLVKAHAKGDRQLERRLSELIGIYWRRGQTMYSLIPDYGKNKGRTSSGEKRGRKSKNDGVGCPLTRELLETFEIYCQKYQTSENNLTLKEIYAEMCSAMNEGADIVDDGSIKESESKDDANKYLGIPSYHQFYYYYRTRYGTLAKKE